MVGIESLTGKRELGRKEGDKMNRCFACGTILRNINKPCEKCGYSFTADTYKECPNKKSSQCRVIRKLCNYVGPYNKCPIKAEADRED